MLALPGSFCTRPNACGDVTNSTDGSPLEPVDDKRTQQHHRIRRIKGTPDRSITAAIESRDPPELAVGPGGAIVRWHVDDVTATLDRLVSLGAKQLEPVTEQGGPGYVTASVVDPFGNVLGIMYNRHYLDILGDRGGA